MIVGPVFTREVVTAPRRARLYVARAAYTGALLILLCTAWQVLTGTQVVSGVGQLARFASTTFQVLAPLQFAVAFFFAALSAASAVALEKDRRTFELLLLSRMTNSELVLGKLLASLLLVFVLIAAAAPVFMLLALMGGVSFVQVGRVLAVTVAAATVSGSLGSLVALWREKTFQTLAATLLALVVWMALWEAVGAGVLGSEWAGLSCETWAAIFSPWRAINEASQSSIDIAIEPALGPLRNSVNAFLASSLVGTVTLNIAAVALVRVWNPSRESRDTVRLVASDDAESPTVAQSPGRVRQVWDNPVLWREVRTWAYGRRMLLIRIAYLAIFALSVYGVALAMSGDTAVNQVVAATAVAPLMILGLTLINAQAVTAVTSERDSRALDLLLVTDLTPREFIFGKLFGVFYNTKEMILLPIVLCGAFWQQGHVGAENLGYAVVGWLVMAMFSATLGLHSAMTYGNSRLAIGVSLGVVFFLFIGVAACLRIVVAFSGSFQYQMQPFLAVMVGGSAALYVALGIRNPSPALGLVAAVCPAGMFYGITSFLLGYPLATFLVLVGAYGFATAAMLIPAIGNFDIATGRTSDDQSG